jgi:hypothetical protein
LDSLGFPWILSSESRLFNGLRGLFRKLFFSRPFPDPRIAERGTGGEAMRKRWDAHQASLS